jgi:hypothetical protein
LSTDPKQPVLKAGLYDNEAGIFTDINALLKHFATKKLRPSRTSPPIANDVGELEFVIDKAALRIYTKVNGTLRYWGLT